MSLRGLCGCDGKPKGDFGTTGGAIVSGDGAVVASSEGVDDGQSQSGSTARACGVGPAESLERAGEETIWKSRTVVGDMDLDIVGANVPDDDADRRGAVLGGVIDEVADHPIEVVGIDTDVLACGAVDLDLTGEAVMVAFADRQ